MVFTTDCDTAEISLRWFVLFKLQVKVYSSPGPLRLMSQFEAAATYVRYFLRPPTDRGIPCGIEALHAASFSDWLEATYASFAALLSSSEPEFTSTPLDRVALSEMTPSILSTLYLSIILIIWSRADLSWTSKLWVNGYCQSNT